jgi:hypothetical protein
MSTGPDRCRARSPGAVAEILAQRFVRKPSRLALLWTVQQAEKHVHDAVAVRFRFYVGRDQPPASSISTAFGLVGGFEFDVAPPPSPQIWGGADQFIREQIGTTAIGVVKLKDARLSP